MSTIGLCVFRQISRDIQYKSNIFLVVVIIEKESVQYM